MNRWEFIKTIMLSISSCFTGFKLFDRATSKPKVTWERDTNFSIRVRPEVQLPVGEPIQVPPKFVYDRVAEVCKEWVGAYSFALEAIEDFGYFNSLKPIRVGTTYKLLIDNVVVETVRVFGRVSPIEGVLSIR